MKPACIATLLAAALIALCSCGGGDGAPFFGDTLVDVLPMEGTTAGGTLVILKGTGFTTLPINVILFGEEPAEGWEIIDDTTIECVSPPGPLGSTVITLRDTDDELLLTGGYRYVALTLYVAGGALAPTTDLFRVDLDSKFPNLVGPIGFPVTSLATRNDGTLFGVEDGPLRRLIQIDPNLGTGSAIALLRDASDQPVDIRDLAFLGSRLLGRTAAGAIVEIDMTLGLVTFLPPPTGPVPGPGICVRDTDLAHLAGASIGDPMHSWIPSSNAALALPPLTSINVLTIDALEFFDGTVYGVELNTSTTASTLLRINPFVGTVEIVTPLPPGIEAVTKDL